ncbi:MAG: thermonuclease family protein [Lentisphaerae bacterium]|nr:thermonuclease family protein [Lentisphaerota bacterium]
MTSKLKWAIAPWLLILLLMGTLLLGGGIGYLVGKPPAAPVVPLNTRDVACLDVLDGDTIKVDWEGGPITVRMLGIDCMETHEGKKLQQQAKEFGLKEDEVLSYGKQAKNRTVAVTKGNTVRLVFPGSPEHRDSFGRLLGYVEADGRDMGKSLLESGLAVEYPAAHPRQDEYKAILEQAQKQRRGFWMMAKRAP